MHQTASIRLQIAEKSLQEAKEFIKKEKSSKQVKNYTKLFKNASKH